MTEAALLTVKVIVRPLIRIGFGPKTLRASPGFDERAVHREVFVVEQSGSTCQRHHLGEELARHFVFHESASVLAKGARVEARLLHVHVQEPAKKKIVRMRLSGHAAK